MKYLLIIALVAAGAFFAWKKYLAPGSSPAPTSADQTPAANRDNRIQNLSGAAPDP